MRSHNPAAPNFLHRSDPAFIKLHNVCDTLFRELHSDGVGVVVKEASVITKEEENTLWSKQILGLHSPKALVHTVFFYVGKVFCLRGREEHRSLKQSQFERRVDPARYIYSEHGSKNRNGGFGQVKIKNKVVPVVSNPNAGERCLVCILDVYFSKLPSASKEKDLFYLQPYPEVPVLANAPWFKNQAIGKNTLGTFVKDMFEEGGICGKTNHSLRATGVTEMYLAGVPEKVIQERTGHRSLEGLRAYERNTLEQHQTFSNIASSSSSNLNYVKELEKITDPVVSGGSEAKVSSSGDLAVDLFSTDSNSTITDHCSTSTGQRVEEVKVRTAQLVEKRLSTLFSCSEGGTFNFCPSGNVIINVNPAVTGMAVEEKLDRLSQF